MARNWKRSPAEVATNAGAPTTIDVCAANKKALVSEIVHDWAEAGCRARGCRYETCSGTIETPRGKAVKTCPFGADHRAVGVVVKKKIHFPPHDPLRLLRWAAKGAEAWDQLLERAAGYMWVLRAAAHRIAEAAAAVKGLEREEWVCLADGLELAWRAAIMARVVE